jgi:hypothetical protein
LWAPAWRGAWTISSAPPSSCRRCPTRARPTAAPAAGRTIPATPSSSSRAISATACCASTAATSTAWAGVTLAFLGGNGAGACYDASAYKGIKFRIRGNVTTPDMFNGTVFVSLVTAETQTQKYGGDLKGEGGHFNKQIKITADWQTVMIPWTDLAKPTWGDTANLAQPALGKMQAIDWGVSNTASTFDYDLDDIELF